jgi:hypothetical protein
MNIQICIRFFAAALLLGASTASQADKQACIALLHNVSEQFLPHSLDYTFIYQKRTFGIEESEALKKNVIQVIDREIANLDKTKEGYHRDLENLTEEREFHRKRFTNDQILLQRQRIRFTGTQVRYEALEDLGSPNDPEDIVLAKQQMRSRTGIYFFDGKDTMVDVNVGTKEALIMGSNFYYPNLCDLLKPIYSQDLDAFAENDDIDIVMSRKDGKVVVTTTFRKDARWEVTVDTENGLRLLADRAYIGDQLTSERTFEGYKKYGDYELPTQVHMWSAQEESSLSVDKLLINPRFGEGVFDYLAVLPEETRMFDLRHSPPLEYIINRKLEVGTLLSDLSEEIQEEHLNTTLESAQDMSTSVSEKQHESVAHSEAEIPLNSPETNPKLLWGVATVVLGLVVLLSSLVLRPKNS